MTKTAILSKQSRYCFPTLSTSLARGKTMMARIIGLSSSKTKSHAGIRPPPCHKQKLPMGNAGDVWGFTAYPLRATQQKGENWQTICRKREARQPLPLPTAQAGTKIPTSCLAGKPSRQPTKTPPLSITETPAKRRHTDQTESLPTGNKT